MPYTFEPHKIEFGYNRISGVMVDLCALLCDRLPVQIVVWSKERLQNLYYQRWSLCNGL